MTRTRRELTTQDGVHLAFERLGAGERTLLILNGFYLFEDFSWLADDRALVGLDLRNRGRSEWVQDPAQLSRGVHQDVDDIEAMRAHLGVERLDLLAHSYAGLVAILYAMRHPSHVGRVVLISPMQPDADAKYPADEMNRDAAFRKFVADAGKLQERRQAYSPQEFCKAFWELLRRLYVFDPADAEKLQPWGACDLDTELHFMRYWSEVLLPSIQTLDFSAAETATATMPVLVIHGTKDRSAPYGGARDWARLLPNTRLLTVEDVAHAPWIEAPDEVRRAIRTFLDGGWPEDAEQR